MKTLCKSIFALTALALVSTTATQAAVLAPVTLHLAGSTAYRSAVYNALAHTLTSPMAMYKDTVGNGILAGASTSTWSGSVPSGSDTQPVIVECQWSGSISTILSLTQNATFGFLKYDSTSALPVVAGGQSNFLSPFGLAPGVGGGGRTSTADNAAANQDPVKADAGFADCFQDTAALVKNTAGTGNAITDTVVSGSVGVGILPFVMVKSSANTNDNANGGATTDYAQYQDLTDITGLGLRQLYGNGSIIESILTGNLADALQIFPLGRDQDSGTRIATFAESNFGVANSPTQYGIVTSGAVYTSNSDGSVNVITTLGGFGPTFSILNATTSWQAAFPTGGYSSGASVAGSLATNGWDAGFAGYAVGYLGAADADTCLTQGTFIINNVAGSQKVVTVPAGYTAVGTTLTGSTISTTDQVYIDGVPGNGATPVTNTVASSVANGDGSYTVTLGTNLAAGTHTVVIDLAGATYVRPQALTFNGVKLNQANVNNGKYQFWEYEHFYTPTTGLSAPLTSFTNAILGNLTGSTADATVAGYTKASMNVAKSHEGFPIHN